MNEVFLTLSSDPVHPQAGKQFTITATLEKTVDQGLKITFEKHRVHVDTSGEHYLCVIQPGYFTDNGIPSPINLKACDKSGTTQVTVNADAQNPSCPPPQQSPPQERVTFPDHLMLTAFVHSADNKIIGQEQIVVTVRR
jgi:hypothetical protein